MAIQGSRPEIIADWRNPDTDGDGIPDGWAYNHGLNPLATNAGAVIWWGSVPQAGSYLPGITNIISLAAGANHALLLEETGVVVAWGTNTFGQTNVAASATNVVAIAAGDAHSLVLTSNRTVVAWGRSTANQANVPTGLTNVIAVAAGGDQSRALLSNGTVTNWGASFAILPASLTNIIAIAAGTNFCLALRSNSTLVAWGSNGSPTNVPAGLTNVVAIAAGGGHALALKTNGTVVAWGINSSGQTNVPANLTNAMGIAAGYAHSMALRNDGSAVVWGDNTFGQTNGPVLTKTKLIAAGGNQSLASTFSTLTQYPVDVTKDILLIYNTNSVDSYNVWSYYVQHRPMKRPQYWVLFLDIPSRINETTNAGTYGVLPKDNSVSYELYSTVQNAPFVTHINMDGTNDCKAYIDKLGFIGTNYSPGKLILSASLGTYGNTNYYFDDTRFDNAPGVPSVANDAKTGVLAVNPSASIVYTNGGNDYDTNLLLHIRNGTNVAGYLSWGGTQRARQPVRDKRRRHLVRQ